MRHIGAAALGLGVMVAAWRPAAAAQDIIKPTTTTTERLPAPTKIAASQQSDGRIRVVWSAVSGAASYSLIRSVPPTPAQRITPNPTDTVYVDSDVKAGSYYYYQVAAVNSAGIVGLRVGSAPVNATTSVQTVSPNLSTVSARLVPPRTITLTWAAVSGDSAIQVRRYFFTDSLGDRQYSGGWLDTLLSPTATSFTNVIAPWPSTRWVEYHVSKPGAGFARSPRVKVDSATMPAVQSVRAQLLSPTRAQVTWSYSTTDSRAYGLIERGVLSATGTTWTQINGIPASQGATGYTDAFTLPEGTALAYRVTVRSDTAISAPVMSNSLTVPAATATGVTATTSPSSPMPAGSFVAVTSPVGIKVAATAALAGQVRTGLTRWVAMDPAIATVDANGTVTGRSAGSTQVLAITRGSEGALTVALFNVTVAP